MPSLDIWDLILYILVNFGGFLDQYGELMLHTIDVSLKVVEHLSTPKRSKHKSTGRKKVVRKKPRRKL